MENPYVYMLCAIKGYLKMDIPNRTTTYTVDKLCHSPVFSQITSMSNYLTNFFRFFTVNLH